MIPRSVIVRRFAMPLVVIGLAVGGFVAQALANKDQVSPPQASAKSWSIDDMAAAVAHFSASGNDESLYPDTPFQILYRIPGAEENTFHVEPGTFLYVKFFFIDDAPPPLGEFPTDKAGAVDYIFAPDQLGGHDLELEIDGEVTSLDDGGYVGGPVSVPGLADGGSNLIQIGAFIPPLSKGTHHVTIRGTFDGDLWDLIFPGFVFEAEINYTVIVE
jgi:hypothetical protein